MASAQTRAAALVTFLGLSAAGFYTVLYHIVASGGNKDIIETMCPQPPTYARSPQLRYTGLSILDATLCNLVPFYHAGFAPQNIANTVRFLAGVPPVVLAYIIEGSRSDSASSVKPLVVGIAYQTCTAAGSMPLGWLALVLSTAGRRDRGRQPLTRAQAKSVFLGIVLGCLLPTAAMLHLQNEYITAYWQVFPLYIWLVQRLWLAIRRGGDRTPAAGFAIVRAALVTVAILSAVPHLSAVYYSPSPAALVRWWPSFAVPDPAETTLYTAAAHLLKWDAIFWYISSFCAAAFLAPSCAEAFALLTLAPITSAIASPGAVIAIYWLRREGELVRAQTASAGASEDKKKR